MAFSYFMNMEKLSLSIAEKHIKFMTDNNFEDDIVLNDEVLINNLENGFVVITQLSCYLESFLNTIINACMLYSGDVLLKCSVEEKMDLIFMYYQKDWAGIKGDNVWAIHKKTTKVRNGMIHYKRNYVGDGTGIPGFSFEGQEVAEFFTKSNMEKMKQGYVKLAEIIANELGLKIYPGIEIFACDGRDGLVNYVYDPSMIEVDEERFEE